MTIWGDNHQKPSTVVQLCSASRPCARRAREPVRSQTVRDRRAQRRARLGPWAGSRLKRVLENLRAQAGPDGPNLADIIEAQKIDVDQLRAWDELTVEDLKYIHEVRSARGESSPFPMWPGALCDRRGRETRSSPVLLFKLISSVRHVF